MRTIAFAALVGVALAAQPALAENVLLPGTLDIPLVEGTWKPEQCRFVHPSDDPALYDCALAPRRLAREAQIAYSNSLTQSGWALAWEGQGGPFYTYLYNRPIANSECADRLNLIIGSDVDPNEWQRMQRAGRGPNEVENYIFIFAKEAEPLCGDQRDPQ
jgi:hypothetical protein